MLNFHFQQKSKIEEKHVKVLEISVFWTYFVKALEKRFIYITSPQVKNNSDSICLFI